LQPVLRPADFVQFDFDQAAKQLIVLAQTVGSRK
jgi:hypothetical protein